MNRARALQTLSRFDIPEYTALDESLDADVIIDLTRRSWGGWDWFSVDAERETREAIAYLRHREAILEAVIRNEERQQRSGHVPRCGDAL